jgi:hypothetical protein
LKAQHVSSGTPLIIRSSNCICSLWFTYGNKVKDFINAKQATEIHAYKHTKRKLYKTNAAIWFNKTCKDKQLNKLFYLIAVCKPEAANTVRAPDDERYAA